MRTAVVEMLAWWVVLLATQVVLISSVDLVELAVAAGIAAGCAVAAHRIRRSAGAGRGRRGAGARAAVLTPWSVLRGGAALVRELLPGDGQGRQAEFRRVALRKDQATAQAALLLAASPDTCVIGIDEGEDGATVQLHALRSRPGPGERAVSSSGDPR